MKYFTILAIVLLTTSYVRSDPCVPSKVENITIDTNFRLTWTTTSTGCTIAEFIIDINDSVQKIPYTYTVNKSEIDLSSLFSCQNYTFNIRAISYDHVAGPTTEKDLFTYISKDANLKISLGTTSITSDALSFQWELEDSSLVTCVSSYEVTYFSEDSEPVTVSQKDTKFTIHKPDPCMTYTFQVKAVVEDTAASAPTAQETIRTMPNAPPPVLQLVSKDTNTTSADLVFNVPSYKTYRCEFTLVVQIIGVNHQQQYKLTVEGNDHRTNPVVIHVDNLKKDNVYDVFVWAENEAGKSNNVEFLLQTLDDNFEN
ncbi:uncharacterized protein [Euwallacea fornicatus]|uniref:uncharacterized protein n=1 Tax=Euwallacea fornicatus TaxID=995702 RepID=UPI00338F5F13